MEQNPKKYVYIKWRCFTMKKIILLATILCLLLVMLVGCVGGKPLITANMTAVDVEMLAVFTGGVPSQAEKKIVTADDDIERILTALGALTIVREANSDDYLAGGIGMIFSFRLTNGYNLVIKNHGNLIYADSGIHVVDGTSLDTDDFWNSLNYVAVRVEESELPIVGKRYVGSLNNPPVSIVESLEALTIYDQNQSFIGYVEEITFDNGNTRSGYLQLRGDTYESGITPHIRVRLEDDITRSEMSLRDLEIGERVVVFHTLKGVAVWVALPFSSSHTANDFMLNLFADQRVYRTTDAIQIWATLEYIGEYDEITIWHSVPSIIFTITDGNTFDMGGSVVDVLEETVLQKGEVYRFEFQKGGGWSADDPDADFWQSFFAEADLRLPAGEYTIAVIGGFSLTERMIDSPSGLRAELSIRVVE